MSAVMDATSNVREITIDAVVESRVAELIERGLLDAPDGLIVRARHEMEAGATPAIVAGAVRKGDADIPGWWKVEINVSLEFRESELQPYEADSLFRVIEEVMGSESPSLLSELATSALAVAGIEYDDSFAVERDEDGEKRTYTCMAICGLIDPN